MRKYSQWNTLEVLEIIFVDIGIPKKELLLKELRSQNMFPQMTVLRLKPVRHGYSVLICHFVQDNTGLCLLSGCNYCQTPF